MDERRIATVSQMNTYIKSILDSVPILKNIWIRGEISNFKKHFSGHMYLTLKDDGGVLRACMFKNANLSLTFVPENGMKVLARGRIGVYERDGQYQLYIEEMEQDGIGDLHIAFEKLKQKLAEEGLFDAQYKKPIPKYPRAVGVITSDTGAAVRDIINILTRRYPCADIILYPAKVQGDGAAEQVAEGIAYFNHARKTGEGPQTDVLIVGRGGGSIEDLWAFNEEVCARAVFASEIPVISAVGHETDFTICDFVADLRAPTPSAAAELAVPSADEVRLQLAGMEKRLCSLLEGLVALKKERLKRLAESTAFTRFSGRLEAAGQAVDVAFEGLVKAYRLRLGEKREQTVAAAAALNAMSPLAVLARGYSVATDASGRILATTEDFSPGARFLLRVSDGQVACEVTEEKG